jgi:hypothetical protein
MGKMKELFMEQISRQLDNKMDDADYQYDVYKTQKVIEELNESLKLKYAEGDIKYVLDLVLGDANPLNEQILYELNELYNLRNDF